MRDADTKLLEEAYQNTIDEGIIGRTGDRLAGVGGAIKGIGSRIAGGAKAGWGAMTGNKGLQTRGQAQAASGVARGTNAKVNSVASRYIDRIQSLITEMETDFSKLGLTPAAVQSVSPDASNALTAIKSEIAKLKASLARGGTVGSAMKKIR